MRIAIGGDHAGYELKSTLRSFLEKAGHEVEDVGADSYDPDDDYPVPSFAVAEAVQSGRAQRGIIVCGSGVGACVAANKMRGVRAGTCHDTYSAHQGVEHDDMNVLTLGARIIGIALAKELVTAFIGAKFIDKERYRRRLEKVRAREQREH